MGCGTRVKDAEGGEPPPAVTPVPPRLSGRYGHPEAAWPGEFGSEREKESGN